MLYLYISLALIGGAAIAYLYAKMRSTSAIKELEKELAIKKEGMDRAEAGLQKAESLLDEERKQVNALTQQLAVAAERERSLNERFASHKEELDKLNEKFRLEFENLATRILKQNTQEFSLSNQKNINEVLDPLRRRIESFEKTVSETYQKNLKDQVDLKAEIKNLHELNTKLSEEANNLTRALRSDTKKQGNWGELVLERLLERSGLIRGVEYIIQETFRNEKGEMIRPDVTIRLPENKHIIIDSKVSLIAYEAFINSETDQQKEKFLKAHVESVKEHVKSLAEKNYQMAEKLDSPDFVLLFMPLESAFSLAIQQQPDLFSFAWEKKIVIVSPTTLLATLMTVGSIWKHEKQTRNALEIARQGGRLYDKFVSFLADLENLGRQIEKSRQTYLEAHKKLSSGSGNIIGKVRILQDLGAKTSKELPPALSDEGFQAEEDEKGE
jgi:DNA recombination protein RmuC